MVYSQEVVLVARYFIRHRPDPWFIKLGLGLLFLNDTMATLSEIFCVYMYLIKNWGNIDYLAYQYWPIVYFCVGTGISALICQSFLSKSTPNLPLSPHPSPLAPHSPTHH